MKQTTKSLVTTLGVLAAAAAIGGAALWVTRDTEKKAEQKEKSAKLFDGLDKAKVRQVKLVRDGKLVALVTRGDAGAPWRIAEPVAAKIPATQPGPNIWAAFTGARQPAPHATLSHIGMEMGLKENLPSPLVSQSSAPISIKAVCSSAFHNFQLAAKD